MRATISDMGPLLLARLLNLNETQEGVLALVFKIADDNGLLLLDLTDLRAMLQFVGDNAAQFKTQYGNVSSASIGAIQRGLLQLEEQGGEHFFGEPMLDVDDLLQTVDGKGVVNILAADKLMNNPRLYASFLLWLLAELFEHLPEVGDPDKPKLVFFFDEAHLLFTDAPQALLEKVEQVVRLIRSKGVGVYFVTQNPLDVPEKVLGQLGNRVQHALRAFTPRDQKAVKAAADTMRPNPEARHRGGDHRARRRRSAGLAARREGHAGRDGARVDVRAGLAHRTDHAGRTQGAHRELARRGRLREDVDRESALEMLKARAEASTGARHASASPIILARWRSSGRFRCRRRFHVMRSAHRSGWIDLWDDRPARWKARRPRGPHGEERRAERRVGDHARRSWLPDGIKALTLAPTRASSAPRPSAHASLRPSSITLRLEFISRLPLGNCITVRDVVADLEQHLYVLHAAGQVPVRLHFVRRLVVVVVVYSSRFCSRSRRLADELDSGIGVERGHALFGELEMIGPVVEPFLRLGVG